MIDGMVLYMTSASLPPLSLFLPPPPLSLSRLHRVQRGAAVKASALMRNALPHSKTQHHTLRPSEHRSVTAKTPEHLRCVSVCVFLCECVCVCVCVCMCGFTGG